MTFGEKLVKLRKNKGWSQSELARQIGVHVGHISRIEHGKAAPSIEVLKKATLALGVSADYLLNDEAEDATPIEIKDKTMAEKLKLIDQLSEKDKSTIIHMIETMLTKQKMVDLLKEETRLEAA